MNVIYERVKIANCCRWSPGNQQCWWCRLAQYLSFAMHWGTHYF